MTLIFFAKVSDDNYPIDQYSWIKKKSEKEESNENNEMYSYNKLFYDIEGELKNSIAFRSLIKLM